MSRPARPRGQLEREVVAAVAAASGPVTAAMVHRELGGDLAYTTVMTTLARLESKGVLSRELVGRAYSYALAADPEDVDASLAAHRMRKVLDAGDNRAGVLARFVADLSAEDEQVLIELLTDHPRLREGGDE